MTSNGPSAAAPAFVDLHCHLAWGLDDGPATPEQALALCQALVAEGVQTVITTPHQLGKFAGNHSSSILDAVRQLQQLLAEHQVPLTVHPGAEWMIDAQTMERFDAVFEQLLTLNHAGRYALVEFPLRCPQYTDRLATELRARDLTPIFAHVDRYVEVLVNPQWVARLIDEGFFIQINTSALDGRDGKEAQRHARRLVQRGLVHFVGSDCHDAEHRPPRFQQALAQVQQWSARAAEILFFKNPRALLAGEEVKPVPPLPWWRRLV